jgi:hypothetical protein
MANDPKVKKFRHEAEPRPDISTPPTEPVWWTFVAGDSTCHVLEIFWYEARDVARQELGMDPEPQCFQPPRPQ